MKTIFCPFLRLGLLLFLIFISSTSVAQYNDSLFFKSGLVKAVEIDTFTLARIKYKYINSKGQFKQSSTNIGTLKYFKIYDETGLLVLDSQEEFYKNLPGKEQDDLSISRHTLSIAPIPLIFLNIKARYNYTFGQNMELGLNARLFYNSPFMGFYDGFGSLTAGVGLKFTPFYNKRFSFGIDFTPSLIINENLNNLILYLPASVDFDLFFTEKIGIAIDFGLGPTISTNFFFVQGRGSLGLLWRFNDKKVIEKPLIYHPFE